MLATTEPEVDTTPLPFERRHAGRLPTQGSYVAVVIDGDQARISTIDMVDQGATGIGLESPIPMPTGAICHLHPHGVIALADVGRVVRCTRVGNTYRIGLVSLRQKAA